MIKVQSAMTTLDIIVCTESTIPSRKMQPVMSRLNSMTSAKLICLVSIFMLFGGSSQSRATAWPTVNRGDLDLNSVDVSMVQYLLRNSDLFVAVDGRFGAQTQQQVRHFQLSRRLAVTGKVDGPTWKQLIVVLHPGDHGDAVRAMQVSLQQYDQRLPVDGHFGGRTMRSLRAFQKLMHLPNNNAVGPLTWQRLTDPLAD